MSVVFVIGFSLTACDLKVFVIMLKGIKQKSVLVTMLWQTLLALLGYVMLTVNEVSHL